jgi:hypothetical protein
MNKQLATLKRSISFNYQPVVREWWANDTLTHIHAESDTPYKALKLLIIKLQKAKVIAL